MSTPEKTVKLILDRSEKLGDLPIFGATANKVRVVSSKPDSHAMELASIIMKDVNLSAKLLKLANSPFFNRGTGKISSISRAVVILGYELIKNMCLTIKLVESFQDDHPTVGMNQLIVRSYLAAGFVKEIATRTGVKNAEESYVCALMHNIGEIAVGYFLPEKFIEIKDLEKKGRTWQEAQRDVLGMTFCEISSELLTSWNFGQGIIQTLKPYNPEQLGPVRNRFQLNHALAGMSNALIGALYIEHDRSKHSFPELMNHLSEAAGIKVHRLEQSLTNSFQESCDLAREYGIDQRLLQPIINESNDDMRDKFARDFAFYVASVENGTVEVQTDPEQTGASTGHRPGNPPAPPAAVVTVAGSPKHRPDSINTIEGTAIRQRTAAQRGEPQPPPPLPDKPPAAPASGSTSPGRRGDPEIQLAIIQEITALVTQSASLNKLFVKVMEGIHRGVGFDRLALCLLNPGRSAYAARLVMGERCEPLQQYLNRKIDVNKDLFSRIVMEGNDLVVENTADPSWRGIIPDDFLERVGATHFIVSAVRGKARPIGFFYADNCISGEPVTPEARRGFLQFVGQARLAIQICAST